MSEPYEPHAFDDNAPALEEDDDEFGAPQEVKIDLNRQINHLMQSFSQDVVQLHWKVSQHAAEIDELKIALAEKESEIAALSEALKSEIDYAEELQAQWKTRQELTRAGGPQPEGAILAPVPAFAAENVELSDGH